jgi:hypothetical protein
MNSNMINSSNSCGLPCEHVLRITDELKHKMIHIQNWKIYASHYNDDTSELGLELKKAQHDYKMHGEKMGVPIIEDIVARAKRPSVDDVFPYFFDGADIEDYNQAQFIEQNNNCITIREWLTSEGVSKQSTSQKSDVLTRDEEMITDMEVDTELEFGVDDIFNINNDHSSEPLAKKLNDLTNNTTSDETPVKKKQLFEYETPSKNDNELI